MTAVVTSTSPSSASATEAIRAASSLHCPSATMWSIAPGRIGRYGDVVAIERERVAHVGQGDRLHEGALGLGVGRDELLVRRHLPHPVHNPRLGGHDERLGRPLGHRADHALGRGDVQTLGPDVTPAHLVNELPGAADSGCTSTSASARSRAALTSARMPLGTWHSPSQTSTRRCGRMRRTCAPRKKSGRKAGLRGWRRSRPARCPRALALTSGVVLT